MTANHGLIAFIGSNISNEGYIEANYGNVILATGNAFTMSFDGDNLIGFAVDEKATTGGRINQSGTIKADGGKVLITANAASSMLDQAINMSGVVQAKSVGVHNGEIVLDANDGTAVVSGKMIATGTKTGETGGTVKVLGDIVALTDGAAVDVSGYAGGGEALIGGNAHAQDQNKMQVMQPCRVVHLCLQTHSLMATAAKLYCGQT